MTSIRPIRGSSSVKLTFNRRFMVVVPTGVSEYFAGIRLWCLASRRWSSVSPGFRGRTPGIPRRLGSGAAGPSSFERAEPQWRASGGASPLGPCVNVVAVVWFASTRGQAGSAVSTESTSNCSQSICIGAPPGLGQRCGGDVVPASSRRSSGTAQVGSRNDRSIAGSRTRWMCAINRAGIDSTDYVQTVVAG